MNKRIESYEELLVEKQRLTALLQVQKQTIRLDIEKIKEELEPVRSAISVAGKFFTRDSSNLLLNIGANRLIDILVKKFLLSRAGWLVRTVVPFLLKNYSSHFISDNKGSILGKLFSLFRKSGANGQEQVPTH
jgi:hypothetical protein